MKLNELLSGNEVVLEIIWGTAKYSVQTNVLAVNAKGVLLHPYVYRGEKMMLDSGYDDVSFNLYFVDASGTRLEWKNVSVVVERYKGEVYYLVRAGLLANKSFNSERRANLRTMVDSAGTVQCGEDFYNVRIKDISDVGVSFYIDASIKIRNIDLVVSFADIVLNQSFEINLPCRVVRIVGQDDGTVLYGCQVFNPPMEVMAYTFKKRLEYKNLQSGRIIHQEAPAAEEKKEAAEEKKDAAEPKQEKAEEKKEAAGLKEEKENKAEEAKE